MAKTFPMKLFLFAFLGWTFDFYDLVLFGFIKDHVSHDLGLSHATESWLLGVALSSSGIGGIVSGLLADRFGKRTLLALTVLIYSIGSAVCGLAPNLWVFLFGRALVGLGVGGEWAIGHGLVAEAVESQYRGRAAALLQAGEPVGVALAAVAGFLVVPLVGWRAVLLGSSATAMLALFMRRSMALPNEKARRHVSLIKVFKGGVGKKMLLAWILVVLKLGTYWTCYTWLPSFLLTDMGQGVGKSTRWVLTAQAGQFAGMLAFGNFADRFGRRPTYSVYSIVTAAALAALAFQWQWLSVHTELFWLTMLTLGIGSGCTAGFGALLAELFPLEVRGMAMGATYNLGRASLLVAPAIVTLMKERYGLPGGLSVPMILAIATASWVWVLPETRGIILPQLFMSPRKGPSPKGRSAANSSSGASSSGLRPVITPPLGTPKLNLGPASDPGKDASTSGTGTPKAKS
jgi:MFS family permease